MRALAIMTRIPVPGKTKTRLISILSPEECAEMHRCFLRDILKTGKETEDTDIYLFYGDEGPLELIEDIVGEGIVTLPQRGKDLGERMKNVFGDLFERGYGEVLLMGSDIPEVSKSDITGAFEGLRERALIFGPTRDGGYYLVGMKHLHEMVFDDRIKWGTPEVFQETLDLLRRSGAEAGLIDYHEDIDTREDLKRFWERNTSGCESTRRYIQEYIRERFI